MAKYKVRDDFVVKVDGKEFKGGDVVELTADQAEAFCLRIEEVAGEKPAKAEPKAKAKADK